MIFGIKEREDFERATECWIRRGKLKGELEIIVSTLENTEGLHTINVT